MTDHTPTPWFVHETKHPHYLGGEHVERRIFTVAIHPQLKDHDSVVSGSVGLGPVKGGPATNMVWMSEEDAAFIVKACNAHADLLGFVQSIADMSPPDFERGDNPSFLIDAAKAALAHIAEKKSAKPSATVFATDRGAS